MGKYDVLAAQVDFDMVEFQRDIGRMLCRIVNGIYHSMPIRDNSNNAIHDDSTFQKHREWPSVYMPS